MSMFASLTTKTIPAPGESGHSIVVQKLSGPSVEAAQRAHIKNCVAGFSGRGWADSFTRRILDGTATEADAEKVAADPLAGYDRYTLCVEGIQSWTLTRKKEKGDGEEPRPVDAKTVFDITDEAMEIIALEVMQLTKPSLFKTDAQLRAERKNV